MNHTKAQGMIQAAIWHSGRHLKEYELLAIEPGCPICANGVHRKKKIQIQRAPDVFFIQCSECNGISADRMPTKSSLDNYYKSYYKSGTEQLITFSEPYRLARLIAKHLIPYERSIRILDYGGGDGQISIELARLIVEQQLAESVDITVMDYVSSKNFCVGDSISVQFKGQGKQIEQTYDLAIVSAVLEHIPELNQTMNDVWKHLVPGGIFYARTPFMVPFAKIIPGLDLTYPAHVHDLGHSFWKTAAKRYAAEELASEPSIVETTFKTNFFRTTLGYLLKAPAKLCTLLSLPVLWPYYGGWQVVWRKPS